jgi:4-hydroxy-tetrahydrodipicolinate synthase
VRALTKETVGDRVATVAGVFTNGRLEAARIARMAQDEGADCLLVFPPDMMAWDAHMRPEMAFEHFQRITDAADLPIILFQYPVASRLMYPLPTLLELCRRFPQIRAIKDFCGDGKLHERHLRELGALEQPVKVLSTHSAWLMSSLVLGCHGLLSGAGSVIANLQVALFEAVQAGDLQRAQAINDRSYPCTRAFYDPPLVDMHNRMKHALVYLGRLPAAHVRPPLMTLEADEISKIQRCMNQAGLTPETAYAMVA